MALPDGLTRREMFLSSDCSSVAPSARWWAYRSVGYVLSSFVAIESASRIVAVSGTGRSVSIGRDAPGDVSKTPA